MNKQEAIKRVEQMGEYESFVDEPISKKSVLNIISQIHEPKKVIVPKFVADWIEWCKNNKITLLGADTAICNNKNIRSLDASGWAWKNQETFVKAWIYGYEVKEEKLYTVKFATEEFGEVYVGFFRDYKRLGMSSFPLEDDDLKSWFTEEELKRFKFWNNPAFEIKEVGE